MAQPFKSFFYFSQEDLSKSMDDIVYKKQWERACLEKQFLHMYLAYYQNLFHSKL